MKRSLLLFLLFIAFNTNAQLAANLAIQLTATAQTSPAQIKISWPPITSDTGYTYSVYKKSITATSWGAPIAALTKSDSSYTDNSVIIDSAYEYNVTENGGKYATGYIYAGIKNPAIHNRGTLIMMIDSVFTDSCSSQLTQLMKDINGDGWQVIRHDISRNLSDTSVHSMIVHDYQTQPNVKAVLLLGHIAVPYSGSLNPDGHPNHLGAWPADVYYGSMNSSAWTDYYAYDTAAGTIAANINIPGDGKFDQTVIPTVVSLQVSRVDFNNMPSFSKTEVQMMRSYLTKDHIYKMDSLTMVHRALIDDNFGYFGGEAFAANGWRNFPPLVGKNNIQAIHMIASLNDSTCQWAYGCGGGSFTSAGGIGTTTDFATNNVNAIFTMIFGSYFGDWNVQNDFMRAPLCSNTPALTSCWAGRPNWYFHHMALGQNIGYSTVVTQSNSSLYTPNYGATGIHIALMGDLTLRTDYIKPVSNLAISTSASGGATITWSKSPDTTVIGYYIYRADSIWGTYSKISNLLTSLTFNDANTSNTKTGLKYYMVRPVKLQTTPSGNYYNLGIGVTDTATVKYHVGIIAINNAAENIIVYPNPAYNSLHISVSSTENICTQYNIIDINGKVLLTAKTLLQIGNNNFTIDITKLPAGNYLLQMSNADAIKWIKL